MEWFDSHIMCVVYIFFVFSANRNLYEAKPHKD